MRTKIIVMAILIAFVLAGGVFAGGGSQPRGTTIRSGTLSVGMAIEYPPMEYMGKDGKTPMGFDVEMARAIAAKMGVKVDFVNTSWDGIFASVDTGKFDCIISAVTITEARLAAHNFSKPYIKNTLAVVLPKGSGLKISTPKDLIGLGIGFQGETTADEYLSGLAKDGLIFTPYRYDDVMRCFDELRLNRIDAIMTDLLVAYEYVGQADSPFEIVWEGGDEVFGICMKKGNDNLTKAIDTALDALFADGTMQKLSNDIFKMDLVSAARK